MLLETLQQSTKSPAVLGSLALCLAAVTIFGSRLVWSTNKSGLILPPGPTPDFFIGNLRQFPKTHTSDGFSVWARTYGDVFYARLPGMPIVVISSYEIALELLAKRPSTTAGRNIGFLFEKLMDLGWMLPFANPGPAHSEIRKMLRRGMGPQRVGHYDSMIEKGTADLLLKLHQSRGDPYTVILNEIGRLVTTFTYGENMWRTMGSDLTAWNRELIGYVIEALPNFYMVDVFQFLRFVPSWAPGAHFKKMANRAKSVSDRVKVIPFTEAQKLHNAGDLGDSIAADLIEEFGPTENARDALGVLYLGGVNTMASVVNAFSHAMFLFPEVAQKVYEEVEAVTDGRRPPEVKDRVHLPYMEATWKEALRWNSCMPLGVPHVVSQDEVLNGFLIPEGTTVFTNNLFMLMDPRVWGDPDVFRPERFLGAGGIDLPNPLSVAFGYGIRVCPGMYLADRLGFQYSAAIVALFSIMPLEGKQRPDPKSIEYSDTTFRTPQGFECQFVPRNEKAKQLLKSLELES